VPSVSTPSDRRATWIIPVVIFALGLVVRLGFLLLEPHASLEGDEHSWLGLARSGIAKPWKPFAPANRGILFYPPIYPWLLRLARDGFGSFNAAMAAQAAIGALLAPAIVFLGRRLYGERPAVVAGIVVALLPELVWFSTHFWSETVFMVFLWWGLERTARAMEGPSRLWTALAAGLLLGLAALTREPALYFLPIAALFLVRRGGAKDAGALILGCALIVAPWTYRNYNLFHELIPISTSGWFNLWQGNTSQSRDEVYRISDEIGDPVAVWKHARQEATRNIRSRQPWWLGQKLRSELPPLLFGQSEPELHMFVRDAYGPVGPWWSIVWRLLLAGPYFVLVALAIYGLRSPLAPGATPRSRWFLPAIVVFYVLVHVASVGSSRYRVPLLPALGLLASAGLANSAKKSAISRVRRAGP
jgi:4-amino-4-deoxy-L-arabinose transferase-like glycosyltransferase